VTEQEPDFTADTFDSDGKEICRDWTRNVCNKGNRCKFAHPPHKITDLLEKSSICHDYQNPKVGRPSCYLSSLMLNLANVCSQLGSSYIVWYGKVYHWLNASGYGCVLCFPQGCSRPKCRYIHVTKDEEDYIRATGDVPASFTEEQVQAIKGSVKITMLNNPWAVQFAGHPRFLLLNVTLEQHLALHSTSYDAVGILDQVILSIFK